MIRKTLNNQLESSKYKTRSTDGSLVWIGILCSIAVIHRKKRRDLWPCNIVGSPIPISIYWKKELQRDTNQALAQYGLLSDELQ